MSASHSAESIERENRDGEINEVPLRATDDEPAHSVVDEAQEERPAAETPLPKLQLFILLYIQLAEPITSTVIYPFVNQLVRKTGVTGGDEDKTGYFAGLIVSSLPTTLVMVADVRGRNPPFMPPRRSVCSSGAALQIALGENQS